LLRAQLSAKLWRIGFVAGGGRPASLETSLYAGFPQGMHELGYVDGRDFTIEWRFAEGQYDRFLEYAAEFARLKIDVIVAGASFAVPPMRQANPGTPIVMGYSIDPVAQGLVSSLAHPGGNTTGLSSAQREIVSKQVDLLPTTVPSLTRLAVLYNPVNSSHAGSLETIEATARQAGITLRLAEVRNPTEIETAFEAIAAERIGAIIVLSDAMLLSRRQRLAELALKARLPSIFSAREYAEAGGLMSYGESLKEFYRRAASYVGKIIRGAKPSDLPVEQPTKFNFVVNRKTAQALGIAIPAHLEIFADEVIE
jgi:putative ABC transport system substrate-binding protein